MKQTDSQKILALDDYRCQDPLCTNLAAHVHHIKFRSEGGSDHPSNCISFCTEHHNIIETGRKVGERWQSGRQYMISVLDTLALRVPFRWRAVRRWLKDCEARKRVGEKVCEVKTANK